MVTRTVATEEDLLDAIDDLGDGDEIIVEPGRYSFTSQLGIRSTGLTLRARNDAILNESNLSIFDWSTASDTHGVHIYADNVTLRGFEVRNTPKTAVNLFNGGGSHPINCSIIRCDVHNAGGYGVYLPGSGHYLQEVYAHNTGKVQDAKTFGDGFNASRGDNNTFVACRAWDNRDDAWDLYDSKNNELYHCWAFNNGQISGSNPNGVGGFKLGIKESGAGDGSGGNNYLERCVAFNNTAWGYNGNNTQNANTLVNCTGWDNDLENFLLLNGGGVEVPHVLKNCLNLAGGIRITSAATEEMNSWNLGLDDSPVRSKDPSNQWFLRPTADSPVIDAGTTSVDVEYSGSAPDLGAFEFWNAPKGGYSTPAEGTLDWDDPLNDNFEAIEQDLEMIADRIQSLRGEDISPPSLETPAEGTLDWHIPLNDNFEAISTAVKNLSAEAEAIGASVSVTEEYNTPAEGTLDWHVPLNDNFEDIEASVVNLTEEISARE